MTSTRQTQSKAPLSFLRNQAGIAAVEFALIIPILLVAYLGATDITQALAIDRKLGQVASTVGDLVAQEKEIDRDKVHAFFQSGLAIMRPFDFEQTKLRLTIVEVSGSSAEVTGATARNWVIDASKGDDYTLPEDMLELADGRYLVVASASYDYQPMFTTIFNATMPLSQRSLNIVRQEVEDFGFDTAAADAPEPEEDDGDGADEDADDSEDGNDDETCAGDSGDQVEGANCENDNNSHDDGGDNDDDGDDGGGGWCPPWGWWC